MLLFTETFTLFLNMFGITSNYNVKKQAMLRGVYVPCPIYGQLD